MLRAIVAIVIVAHGIGHVLWFLASWTTVTRRQGATLLGVTRVPIRGWLGRASGIVALFLVAGFVAAGIGLWAKADWWLPTAVVSSIVSLVLVVAWWRAAPAAANVIGALAVDVFLLILATTDCGETFLEETLEV